jgi:hypothetical protein
MSEWDISEEELTSVSSALSKHGFPVKNLVPHALRFAI